MPEEKKEKIQIQKPHIRDMYQDNPEEIERATEIQGPLKAPPIVNKTMRSIGSYAPYFAGTLGAIAGSPWGIPGRMAGSGITSTLGELFRQRTAGEPDNWNAALTEGGINSALEGGSHLLPSVLAYKYGPKILKHGGEFLEYLRGLLNKGAKVVGEEAPNFGRTAAQAAESEFKPPPRYGRGAEGMRPSSPVEPPPRPKTGPMESKVTGATSQPGTPPDYSVPPFGGNLGAPEGAGVPAKRPGEPGFSKREAYYRRNRPRTVSGETTVVHGGKSPGSVVEASEIGTGNSQSAGNLTRSAEVPQGRSSPFRETPKLEAPGGEVAPISSRPGFGYQTGFGGSSGQIPPRKPIPIGPLVDYFNKIGSMKNTDMFPGAIGRGVYNSLGINRRADIYDREAEEERKKASSLTGAR